VVLTVVYQEPVTTPAQLKERQVWRDIRECKRYCLLQNTIIKYEDIRFMVELI